MHSFLPLKASLQPLQCDPARDSVPDGLRDYDAFYQLNTSPALHRMGAVASGPYRLAAQYWCPPDAQQTVLLVHGYYDHLGLYRHAIRYWLTRGYAVLGFDLPGHGLSSGPRAVIQDFDEYGSAVASVLAAAAQGSLPPVTLGHGQSTGAAALLNCLMAGYPTALQQLVLFSPLLRPHQWQQTGRWTYLALHRWIDGLPRAFRDNSGDRDFLQFIRTQDPLQPRQLPVAWVSAMASWLERFPQQPAIPLPTLIVQGEQDTTVDWRYNIPHLCEKLPQAQLHYIAEARHHLVNESPAIRAHLWQVLDDYLTPPADED